jgi:DNA-binding transcriptional LysR family regulator
MAVIGLGDGNRMWSHRAVEIRELRIFVAVVDEAGMSAAARKLHLGQSTVSETVRALERELGTGLLLRSRTGVQPTDSGLTLADGARRLIQLHDQLRDRVAQPGKTGAAIRLGAPLELPAGLLPQVVDTLRRSSPGIVIEASHRSTASQWASLRRGEIEVGLVRELLADDAYDSTLVVTEAMGVVLADDLSRRLAGEREQIGLDRLAGLRWIGFPRSNSPSWHDHVSATLRAHGIRVPAGDPDDHRPVTPEVKLAAVVDGTRFALAAPGFAIPHGMRWHQLAGHPLVRRTWAVWPAGSRSSALAAVVAALEDARLNLV